MISTRLTVLDRRWSAQPGGLRLRRRRDRLARARSRSGWSSRSPGPTRRSASATRPPSSRQVAPINDDGGVLGRDLEVTIKDDKTDVPQSVTEYNQLAADRATPRSCRRRSSRRRPRPGRVPRATRSRRSRWDRSARSRTAATPTRSRAWRSPSSTPQAMVDYIAVGGRRVDRRRATPARTSTASYGNEATIAAAEAAGIDVVVDESIDVSGDRLHAGDLEGQGRRARRLPRLGRRSGIGDHHQAVRRVRHPAPDDRRAGLAAVRRARGRGRRGGRDDQQHRRAGPRAAGRPAQGRGRRVHRARG